MLLRERVQLVVARRDAVAEDVAVSRAGEDAVQLDAREHRDPVDRVVARDAPVVGDRQHVVAGAGVVALRDPAAPSSPSERVVWACRAQRSQLPCDAQGRLTWSATITHSFTSGPPGGRIALVRSTRPNQEVIVEDYQEQEYEFWRRLDEETVDRRRLLKRGLVAGAGGLTILSLSEPALAARAAALANPPLKGTPGTMKELVAAGEEGRPSQRHRAARRLGELRRDHQDLPEALRHPVRANDNPGGSSAAENQAIVSLKGDPRAPDCVDVTVCGSRSKASRRASTDGTTSTGTRRSRAQ